MPNSLIWENPRRVPAGRRPAPKTPNMQELSGAPTDLMTVRALAEEFPGIGERWIRRCVDERRVPLFRVGGRVLISRSEFGAFLAAGRVEPVPA